MPRHSITNMIREGIRNGISYEVLLRRAHEMSPNPEAWSLDSLRRIARDMGITRPTIPQQPQPLETPLRGTHSFLDPPRSASGLIRSLLSTNESHENILSRVRTFIRSRNGNPNAWNLTSIERIARDMRFSATRNATTTTTPTLPTGIDNNATYGVEIEFLIPDIITRAQLVDKLDDAGIPIREEPYNHTERSWWKLTFDSSVKTDGDKDIGYYGNNELVSPIFHGTNGLESIRKVCHILASLKCKVNKTCGLHVHHGVNWQGVPVVKFFKNAYLIYLHYQNKLKAMMPRSRHNGQWCRSVPNSFLNRFNGTEVSQQDLSHYTALNLQAYWHHGTLEFRLHSGTLDFEKISNWIIITQKMILKAKTFTENNEDVSSYAFKKINIEFNWTHTLKAYYESRVAKFSNSLIEEVA